MSEEQDEKKTKSANRRILAVVTVILVCFLVALTAGLVLHFELNDDDSTVSNKTAGTVDCYPELRMSLERMAQNEDACVKRGCIWRKLQNSKAPWCVFPESDGYQMASEPAKTNSGYQVELSRIPSPRTVETEYFDSVVVDVEEQTDNRVRVKIYPKDKTLWEIPTEALNIEATNSQLSENKTYNVTFSDNPFGIIITRISTDTVIFNTSFPGMVVADHFLQITTRLTNDQLYGFGEHRHKSLKHDMNWRIWSMFTRDSGPNSDWNLYGHHPVYMNVENDATANMVLVKNSNAMEVVLQPDPEPAVTYRAIGGVLDFYVFLGDSPADVVKHYIKAIGQPVFPPYWSLGYHLSRWGYSDIEHMRTVITRNRAAGIPYEAQWADIDTFHKAYVFTYDKQDWTDFPALVDDLKANNQHFVTIVDPGIGADQNIIAEVQGNFVGYDMLQSGETEGIFIKAADNTTLYGQVWPGKTAYPDFTNDDSQGWWTRWIQFYINDVGVNIEALWIDMNEPSNFVPGSLDGCDLNNLNYPPYTPNVEGAEEEGRLYVKTLCMDAQQKWGQHYDVHSLYGHTMAMRTHKSLQDIFPTKRPWTMTRSSFVGTGHYATKWQGDNRAEWDNMHFSIISLMEFGLFGFPMNGADVCGFWLEPSSQLCVRWHQLGAFYPFMRNHNGKGDAQVFKDQDPAAFGSDFVDLIKPVLMTRIKFLPYLYTLLYRAHVDGDLVFKPLFFEFPSDKKTLSIDQQFMLGSAFLLSPVLKENATKVKAYFPEGQWYDYSTAEQIEGPKEATLETPLTKFNLHLQGGLIIPTQKPALRTFLSRQNDLGLVVALDAFGTANGEMYWDDGESNIDSANPNYNLITFKMERPRMLRIEPITSGLSSNLKFTTLEIYGLSRMPSEFTVNTNSVLNDDILNFNGIVTLKNLNIPMTSSSVVSWTSY